MNRILFYVAAFIVGATMALPVTLGLLIGGLAFGFGGKLVWLIAMPILTGACLCVVFAMQGDKSE